MFIVLAILLVLLVVYGFLVFDAAWGSVARKTIPPTLIYSINVCSDCMLKYCRLCGVVADLSKVCVERQCFSVQLQAAAVSRNREETTAMPIYLLWDKGVLSRME